MKSLFGLLIGIVFALSKANAAEVLWNNRLEGSAVYGGQMMITDGDYTDLNVVGAFKDVDAKTYSYIRLGLAEVPGMTYTSVTTSFYVVVKITPFDNFGVIQSSFNQTLTAQYTQTQGAGVTIDADDYRMTGVHKFIVEVQSITINGTLANASMIPNYVFLESGFYAERYYQLNVTTPPVASHKFVTYNSNGVLTYVNSLNTSVDEYELVWEYVAGAEYYDLEWTWVDNYSSVNPATPLLMSDISLSEQEFAHNSTRVRVSGQNYRIPQTFAKGYLVYRVRGVGRWIDSPMLDKYGKWSGNTTTKVKVSDWGPSNIINVIQEHEGGKNWQYQATYAENGKKKEVAQYFDGSLRNRQTVTRINSDNQSIVGETVYDNEGRGVIQVLPVPQKNPAIQYYPGLNNNGSGQTYSHKDFDWELQDADCAVTPAGNMSTTTGAANYYSPGAHTTDTDWQQYVPDAQQYPFTQVEYTPDNTGRIRNQSGVGATHKIGSGHETFYYYLQPSQQELDRLFGYKVGYKQRYKKNMVVDANGQVSVSYLDAQGRVIATALSANNQTAFEDVDSENNGVHQTVTTDLLNKLAPTDVNMINDDNVLFSTGAFGALEDGLKMGTQIGVIQDESVYNFTYTIITDNYETTCGETTLSYPFVYDLTLSFRDDCGQELFQSSYPAVGIQQIGGLTGTSVTHAENVLHLKKGSYTLYKEIKVNEASLAAYKAHYLSGANACVLDDSSFYEDVIEDCGMTCQECADELGTWIEFKAEAILDEGHPLTTEEEAVYQNMYNQLLDDCISACLPVTSCDAYYGIMIGDMKPQGQYGGVDPNDHTSVFNQYNWLYANIGGTGHWKNSSLVYKDEFGNPSMIAVEYDGTNYSPSITSDPAAPNHLPGTYYVIPQELSYAADFIAVFKESWADELLQFHPEYPLYQYVLAICAGETTINSTSNVAVSMSSEVFNDVVNNQATTYDQARAVETTVDGLNFHTIDLLQTGNLMGIDPYFHLSYAVHNNIDANATTLKNALMNQAMTNYEGTNLSMLTYAAKTVVCGNDFNNSCSVGTVTVANLSNTADPLYPYRDQIWQTYKSYYLSYKAKINQLFMDIHGFRYLTPVNHTIPGVGTTAINVGLFNGAIGSGGVNVGVTNAFSHDVVNFGSVMSLVLINYSQAYSYTGPLGLQITAHFPPSALAGVSYNSKIIRITRIDALYNSAMSDENIIAELTQDADYATWEGTGLCPLTLDMERLIDALGRENHLIGTNTMDNTPEMTPDLYTALSGVVISSSAPDMNITGSAGGSGSPLVLTFSLTSGAPNNHTITIPELSSALNWNAYGSAWHIYSISNSFPIAGSNGVQILVKAGGTLATAQEYVVTYQSQINLNGCQTEYTTNGNLDPNCPKEEELESALLTLMQTMVQNGTFLTSSGVSLAAIPEYTESVLVNYLGNTTPMWYGTANYLRIVSGSNALSIPVSNMPAVQFINSIEFIGTTVYVNYIYNSTLSTKSATYEYQFNNTKNVILDLSCPCEPEVSKELAIEGVFNYLLSHSTVPQGYKPTSIEALQPYLSMSDAVVFSWDNQLYNASFVSQAPNYDRFSPTCSANLVVSNGTIVTSISNVIMTSATNFSCTALLSNNTTITITGSIACLQNAAPCDDCGPQLQAPISCTDAYTTYTTFMHAQFAGSLSSSDLTIFEQEYMVNQDLFCANQFAYILDAYMDYITTRSIASVLNINYMSISQFGATPLGYSSILLSNAIDPYITYIGTSGNENTTWNEYVANIYLPAHSEICPANSPQVSFPADGGTFPCDQWANFVANVNMASQYEIYLAQMGASFTQDYIQQAMATVVETFTESHLDKEYHYTLYYYDRAGNLIQTVPPQGVDRLEVGEANTATYTQMDALRASTPEETLNTIAGIKKAPEHTFETKYRYNSLNQLVYQETPDGGISKFAYDRLGRLVMSQNAKQANLSPERFSYTRYDGLGRVVEAGEFISDNAYNYEITEEGQVRYDLTVFTGLTGQNAPDFPSNMDASRVEVTRSIYDELKFMNGVTLTDVTSPVVGGTSTITSLFGSTYAANNTRNRIVGVIYQSTFNTNMNVYDNATFYDYDVHGNVAQMLQITTDANLLALGQHIKHLNYNYDLVSGNVNKVIYQKGYVDQFIHRYQYDSDNRIVVAETSKDDVVFEKDAKYFYYDHGPLARTEIGEKKVEATDYAYTIQGWLKSVNGEEIDANKMMGADGRTSASLNAYAGRDVFGYSLSYFSGDYNANTMAMLGHSQNAAVGNQNQLWKDEGYPTPNIDRQYYNGNIRAMHTAISGLTEQLMGNVDNGTGAPQPAYTHRTVYEYDQLNRITDMKGYQAITPGTTPVASGYASKYSFDANGNIKTLKNWTPSNNASVVQIDDFDYKYLLNNNSEYTPDIQPATQPLATNRLGHVDDLISAGILSGDLDDQAANNYEYDKIGQLTKDVAENISLIEWTVTNKVKKVTYGGALAGKTIEFTYDAMGHRIAKNVVSTNGSWEKTFYVLDAQGNPMSIYSFTHSLDDDNILYLSERNLYGSSRIGVEDLNTTTVLGMQPLTAPIPTANAHYTNLIGDKAYELANHLGNVLNVVKDRKLATSTNGTTVAYFQPDVVSYSDYYPFGQALPYRNGNTPEYRYSFQGQEKDDELKGANNSLNFEYRMHDPRIGRFFAVDPLASQYPYNSPYAFSENEVMNAVELEGLEKVHVYNVWYDGDGNKHVKKSHTKIDNSSNVDVRVYRYFDEHGKVSKTRTEEIKTQQWSPPTPTNTSPTKQPVAVENSNVGQCFPNSPTIKGTPSTTSNDAPEGYKTVPGTRKQVESENSGPTMAGAGAVVISTSETGPGILVGLLLYVSYEIITYEPNHQYVEQIVPVTSSGYEIQEAQRGRNNGRLQDDERQAIQERINSGNASSSDMQKWKKDQKNLGQRRSRQSGDKK
jgi:RHS repeat-associated protein